MTIYEHETAVISASETGQYKHKYCTCTCTIKYRRIQYPFAFTYSGLYDLFHTLQKVEKFRHDQDSNPHGRKKNGLNLFVKRVILMQGPC